MTCTATPRREQGFTLVELMVAIFVLLVGVLGVVSLVDGANRTTASNRAREGATNLTRELIEDARSVPYGALDTTSLAATLASLSGGVVQAGGTVVFDRRGSTYTLTPTLCYVDDPKDGYGSHAGATFCNSNAASTPPDGFSRDYKRFTIEMTWSGARGSGTSRQSAVINDPGSSFAPQLTAFSMTSPTTCVGSPACTQVDAGASPTASFSATTSVPASKVSWYVNDTLMGTAAGSGTGPWTFSWPLSTVATGAYTVSVRANSGKDGAVRAIVVPVKESPISAPTNPFGGFNQLWSDVVELNWTPVAGSVLGYEVERMVGGVWSAKIPCYDATGVTAASPRPTGSTCLDKSAAGATQYRIYTVFLVGGTPTRSGSAAIVTIGANLRPCPVASLTMTRATDTIGWTAPSSTSGSCDKTRVRAYRVYRYVSATGSLPGGFTLALADRLFKTSDATVLQYKDTSRTNKIFYWVTAIDDRNAESTVVGPVN